MPMKCQSSQKILMIIGLFSPCIGGAERECQNLAKKLISMGHSVTVLTGFVEGLPPFENIDGIPVYRKIRGWHVFELTYMVSVFMLLWRHRKNFDHIICFGLYLYTAPAVLFARCSGKKAFFRLECSSVLGDFQKLTRLKSQKFILSCAKFADGIIAISSEIENELLSHGFNKNKIIRIPNSVDTGSFTPFPDMQKQAIPAISFIGRLDHQKGVDVLLHALKILADKGISFKANIVGDGPSRQELMQEAAELCLLDHMQFTGMVQNVAPVYQQTGIMVMPSRFEGLPLVLLEGMACGLGIIATCVGGIPEVLDPDATGQASKSGYKLCDNGILVQPDDATTLASAISLLIEDQDLRLRMGVHARQLIAQRYALDTVVQKYLNLLAHP
jgi:glycosyltransferase involved in cell wall biosynthesis